MGIELVHFSIGKPKQMKYSEDKEMITGICKELTEEAFLSKDGFLGDDVADLKHHGGPDARRLRVSTRALLTMGRGISNNTPSFCIWRKHYRNKYVRE